MQALRANYFRTSTLIPNYFFPHSGRGYSPSSALRSIALATTALSSWYVTPYQRSGQVSTRAVAR